MEEHYKRLAKQGKLVVKEDKYINNGDLNFKGLYLGFEWNDVCEWIRDNEVYGEDGAGYTYISRDGDYNPEFKEIVNAILDEAQEEQLKVIDDN